MSANLYLLTWWNLPEDLNFSFSHVAPRPCGNFSTFAAWRVTYTVSRSLEYMLEGHGYYWIVLEAKWSCSSKIILILSLYIWYYFNCVEWKTERDWYNHIELLNTYYISLSITAIWIEECCLENAQHEIAYTFVEDNYIRSSVSFISVVNTFLPILVNLSSVN